MSHWEESGEIESDPTEVAPDGGGNAQAAGIRPTTPHARAVDSAPAGPAWRRIGSARGVSYCRSCGVAQPAIARPTCENCGAAIGPARTTRVN